MALQGSTLFASVSDMLFLNMWSRFLLSIPSGWQPPNSGSKFHLNLKRELLFWNACFWCRSTATTVVIISNHCTFHCPQGGPARQPYSTRYGPERQAQSNTESLLLSVLHWHHAVLLYEYLWRRRRASLRAEDATAVLIPQSGFSLWHHWIESKIKAQNNLSRESRTSTRSFQSWHFRASRPLCWSWWGRVKQE